MVGRLVHLMWGGDGGGDCERVFEETQTEPFTPCTTCPGHSMNPTVSALASVSLCSRYRVPTAECRVRGVIVLSSSGPTSTRSPRAWSRRPKRPSLQSR